MYIILIHCNVLFYNAMVSEVHIPEKNIIRLQAYLENYSIFGYEKFQEMWIKEWKLTVTKSQPPIYNTKSVWLTSSKSHQYGHKIKR